MNKSSAQHNIESLTLIAYRLEELCNIVKERMLAIMNVGA